jgi:hypothetical protein
LPNVGQEFSPRPGSCGLGGPVTLTHKFTWPKMWKVSVPRDAWGPEWVLSVWNRHSNSLMSVRALPHSSQLSLAKAIPP